MDERLSSDPRGSAVAISNLQFAYKSGTPVLDIPSLEVAAGEQVFLHGPSGSGKTTLLGILAGILPAGSGRVSILGHDLATLGASARDALRASHMGYIFQMFNLIPYLSVFENIALPCRMNAQRRARLGGQDIASAARALIESLGIGHLEKTAVTELSVGQQQRVAVARALMGSPALVIADEPTSALDADAREAFLKILFAQCKVHGSTLVFVSHDASLMPLFPRKLALRELNRAAQPRASGA